ncbi:MAG: hypothetical protein WBQ57_11875 [Rhodanobacteraceae bacterium]
MRTECVPEQFIVLSASPRGGVKPPLLICMSLPAIVTERRPLLSRSGNGHASGAKMGCEASPQETMMSLSARRSFLIACVAILSGQPLIGQTQTTLDLSYGQSSPCTFVTDSAGIHLDPASGHLLANGTFGSGCQTSAVDPNFTDPLAGDIPASVVTGTDLTLGWSVANATSCVYNGSSFPAGFSSPNWPTTGSACDSTASCAGAHSTTITASVDGTYHFNLTCNNGNNPTTVSSAATTVASPDGGTVCNGPVGLTRLTVGNVTYVPGFATAVNADVTQYQNIWGRSSPADPPQPWPAIDNQIAYIDTLPQDKYLAAEFTVPLNPVNFSGQFKRADIAGDVSHTSASISETCGDFYVDVGPGCVIDSGNRASPLLVWNIGAQVTGVCRVIPGHTYYLNIMMAPLNDPTNSYCQTTGCVMSGLGHVLD